MITITEKSNGRLTVFVLCLFLWSAFNHQALGQDVDCKCDEVFGQMTDKLEANYIGLKHFRERGRGQEYEDRKREFASKASGVSGVDCASFLQEFLDYFDDGHLYVIERPVYKGQKLDSIHARIEAGRKSVEELRQTLENQKKNSKDPVIGFYKDQTSEFVVIREGDDYRGYLTTSKNDQVKPGELKMVFRPAKQGFRGTYYSYGHMPRFMKGGLYKQGTLLRVESSILIKTDTEFKRELGMVNFEGTDWPTVQELDNENVLLSIPSFSVDFQVWKNVIGDNEEVLKNAKNLIIDIRGNRGGNAIYFSIFDLFADSEMPGGQGKILASEDNLDYFKRNLQFSKKVYQPVVDAIGKNMGQIVDGPLYPRRKYRKKKSSKIEHVAILTDEACMSAAESFILHCKQNSTLVKTFGSPTDGVIDYTSVNALLLKSGRQNIYFGYPTGTLHKQIPENGYNKTGILPDVPIAAAVKDKIAYIMDHYKRN